MEIKPELANPISLSTNPSSPLLATTIDIVNELLHVGGPAHQGPAAGGAAPHLLQIGVCVLCCAHFI